MCSRMAFYNLSAGIAVFTCSWILLALDVEPFPTWFYCFAWWSYILFIDSVIFLRRGNSLILSRTREFLFLLPVSVFIWLIFECFNLILKNWYYVNVIEITPLRWIGYSASFATVLPGIFETAEFLESTSLLRQWRATPRSFSIGIHIFIMLAGIACLMLSAFYPRYCFSLVWCGFVLFLDPVNYRCGAPSFLKYGECGELRKPALLMIAGLLCGIFWEFCNYWATTKWIYTVPFFDEFKLFEMTGPGFLGFVPFALECYVMTCFVYLFRKKPGWEQEMCTRYRQTGVRPFFKFLLIICCSIFCFSVFKSIDITTVDSYRSFVHDMETIDKGKRARLEQCAIVMVNDLVNLGKSEYRQRAIQQCAAVLPDELGQWIQDAEMVLLKGMGVRNFLLLYHAGIKNLRQLSSQDPRMLRAALEQNGLRVNRKTRIPEEAKLKVWITAAKKAVAA